MRAAAEVVQMPDGYQSVEVDQPLLFGIAVGDAGHHDHAEVVPGERLLLPEHAAVAHLVAEVPVLPPDVEQRGAGLRDRELQRVDAAFTQLASEFPGQLENLPESRFGFPDGVCVVQEIPPGAEIVNVGPETQLHIVQGGFEVVERPGREAGCGGEKDRQYRRR